MERILEHVLPARFGGNSLDYQLAEEEGDDGLTRLTLIVSPSVGPLDETAMVEHVLEELRRGGDMAATARASWGPAGTLRVRRAAPFLTARGKMPPLYRVPRSSASGEAGATAPTDQQPIATGRPAPT
jgi:hypothetical protein